MNRTEKMETENELMTDGMEFDNEDSLKVVYVYNVGKNTEGYNIYTFLLSRNIEDTWAEMWEERPACNCGDLTPDETMWEERKELVTDIILDLAQDNSCFSMQDARDTIVALAYENLDDAEEYPENGRIVIHFGDSIDDVERMLARRDLKLRFV